MCAGGCCSQVASTYNDADIFCYLQDCHMGRTGRSKVQLQIPFPYRCSDMPAVQVPVASTSCVRHARPTMSQAATKLRVQLERQAALTMLMALQ